MSLLAMSAATATTDPLRKISRQLNAMKKSLRRRLVAEFETMLPAALIRRALDEAEQIAHETGFPHLVFPVLAEEQVRRVSYVATHEDASARSHHRIYAA
jgi:AraC-like DNA-binding protein